MMVIFCSESASLNKDILACFIGVNFIFLPSELRKAPLGFKCLLTLET